MDAAAWIGFGSGLIAAGVSLYVARRQADLAAEIHRREGEIDRDLAAADVLARYRAPLAAAAFDLQSRLYNILELNFFGKFGTSHARGELALKTTLYRLAQYFGWSEILRRDIQFLSFPEAEHTRTVAKLQSDISKAFLTDGYGPAMMIWGDEQRAIGELMIVEAHDKLLSMGFATFSERCSDLFEPWLDRLRSELPQTGAQERLRAVQHLLCELVETLDDKRLRYDEDLLRA